MCLGFRLRHVYYLSYPNVCLYRSPIDPCCHLTGIGNVHKWCPNLGGVKQNRTRGVGSLAKIGHPIFWYSCWVFFHKKIWEKYCFQKCFITIFLITKYKAHPALFQAKQKFQMNGGSGITFHSRHYLGCTDSILNILYWKMWKVLLTFWILSKVCSARLPDFSLRILE